MKALFLWSDISGYMAACWRALAATPDIQLRVMAYGSSAVTDFHTALMNGIDWIGLNDACRYDASFLKAQIDLFEPDVVVLSGWFNPAYRRLPRLAASAGRRFILTMDTPWRGTARQVLAPYLLQPFCRRIDSVVVTGERSWQYARRLGFRERKIIRGLYGVDHASLSPLLDARLQAGSWPQQFLFAGRYSPEKGLDLLLDAYAAYRARTANPWPLVCCGKGPLAPHLARAEGVRDLGFLQPHELRRVMETIGAFVLPSTFDPWPLALVEACSAGLPVIASEACGSAVELIRDGYSGFTFATGDRDHLVQSLTRVHEHRSLPEIGRRARESAAAYSAEEWARRWRNHLLGKEASATAS
jgi:glycosyltransferase involved in cell wall biosynthesis